MSSNRNVCPTIVNKNATESKWVINGKKDSVDIFYEFFQLKLKAIRIKRENYYELYETLRCCTYNLESIRIFAVLF